MSSAKNQNSEVETNLEKTIFSPPLYQQRYIKAAEIIKDYSKCHSVAKVVDIGSAELNFFKYLKQVRGIQEIVLVDIDTPLLQECSFKIKPFAYDYIVRRKEPLTVSVINADVTFLHAPLFHADVVTMIEFIEHLYEEDLASVVSNIFGEIQPHLVIVTTPNADYNKHFPNLISGKFRHHDHKFEWSKIQFHKWCMEIINTYPKYTAVFSGCGADEENTFCTQIAVFSSEQREAVDRCNILSKSPCTVNDNSNCQNLSYCTGSCISDVEQNGCYVIQSLEYPCDSRSSAEILRNDIISSLFDLRTRLRSWLDKFSLQYPDEECHFTDDADGKFVSSPNRFFEMFQTGGCESSDALGSFSKQLKDSVIEHPEKSHQSIPCVESSCETSSTSVVEKVDRAAFYGRLVAMDEVFDILNDISNTNDTFFYIDSENLVLFTLTAFCTWSNVQFDTELLLETLENTSYVKVLDGKSTKFIILDTEDTEANWDDIVQLMCTRK